VTNSMKSAFIAAAFVPAFIAFFSAQSLIETFFPNVTLIDLGVFYVLGVISGLFLGLFLAFSRRG
jgi:choline-glycine betaine transporter